MVNIQIVSDTHAEFWADRTKFNFIKPSAPILALLGDICCCASVEDFEIFKRFINELLPYYEHIIMVPGNHEYYYTPNKRIPPKPSNTIDVVDARIKAYFKATSPKLHFLSNASMKIKSGKTTYLIVGSTLWSWIPEEARQKIQSSMNDYRFIYKLTGQKVQQITSADIANRHLKNYKYIKSQIIKAKSAGYKVIVFTHHKPYLSSTYNPQGLDVAYESDLSGIISAPVAIWAYGHTHIADNTLLNGVRMYSNPKGYPRQKTKYSAEAILKI